MPFFELPAPTDPVNLTIAIFILLQLLLRRPHPTILRNRHYRQSRRFASPICTGRARERKQGGICSEVNNTAFEPYVENWIGFKLTKKEAQWVADQYRNAKFS